MKKALCSFLASVVLFTAVLSSPVRAEAVAPSPSDIINIVSIFVSLLQIWNNQPTVQNRANLDSMWQLSPNFNRSVALDADQLWRIQAELTESGNACYIYSSSFNGLTAYYIRGIGGANIPQVNASLNGWIPFINTDYVIQDRYFCNEDGYVLYSLHYPSSYTLSSINMRMTSFFNDVISKLNQILNALPSSINYTTVLNNIDARLNTIGGYVDQIEAKQDVGNGLLNNIDQRLNTIGGYVDQIEVKLDNLHNDLVSISGQLSSIINLLRGSNPLGDQLFVIPMSSPISDVRYIPYDTMVQLCADIISNHNLQKVTVIESGATTGYLIDSASMTRSFLVEENDYYSLIVRYSLSGFGGSLEETGRLCDVNGHPYRSFQQDNYLFRIYNKVDQIYNWLDNADLLTGEDIETMISNTNSKVLQFLPFSNNFIQMVNNVFPASPSLDWAGMNNYLQTVGRDAE